MANLRAVRQEDKAPRPAISIGDRATDNLRFIRETMERSTHFTAVPGYGGMLMGVTAVGAAYIASTQSLLRDSLITWLIEAFLALAIGILAMWQKSKIAGESLLSAPAKKFALGFLPPMLVGVVTVLGLARHGEFYILPPIAMLAYGAAVVCGGAYSVRIVQAMGWSFMALGTLAFVLPASYGNLMMGASFGVLHIIFGAIIGKRHGG